MVAFARLFLFPVTAGAAAGRPADPDPAAISQMMGVFRPMLLNRTGMLQVKLDLAEEGLIRLIWSPCGLTSGIGVWVENNQSRRVLAASLLRSGLDAMDDSRAIATLLNSKLLPCSLKGWNAVTSAPAPLLANLYRDDAAMADKRIAIGSTALAAAFFGLLGISCDQRADAERDDFDSDEADDQNDDEDQEGFNE